ncbi:unnamed protein product [Closterium sp. Naga37s-1]|nr:unnamed protein product [Closterium sp. Naga37s-1]
MVTLTFPLWCLAYSSPFLMYLPLASRPSFPPPVSPPPVSSPPPPDSSPPPPDSSPPPPVSSPPPPVSSPPPPVSSPPPPVSSPPPLTASPPPLTASPPPLTASPPPLTASPPPLTASPPPLTASPPPPSPSPPPPSPFASGKACPASTLPGYAYQLALLPPNLILHWDPVSPKQVDIAIEAKAAGKAKAGWISVGWPTKAAMVPADAVIGNLPGGRVATYALKGYRSSKLVPTTAIKIENASTTKTADSSTIIRFSRIKGTGVAAKFASTAVSKLIWAFSSTGSSRLNFHDNNFGTAKVDFSCRVAPSSDPSPDIEEEL